MSSILKPFLLAFFILGLVRQTLAQDSYLDELNSEDNLESYESLSYEDLFKDHGYYDDPDQTYYEYTGSFPEDEDSEFKDYYLENSYDEIESSKCEIVKGRPAVGNTTVCSLRVSNGDGTLMKLAGGVDGIYEPVDCYNGKPLYRRVNTTGDNARIIWYSDSFGDWDFAPGDKPQDSSIFMYGGEFLHLSSPEHVGLWQVSSVLTHPGQDVPGAGDEDGEFVPISVNISCVDGSRQKNVPSADAARPLLTNEEMDAKYRYIYSKYGSTPTVSTVSNLTIAMLFVLTGIVAVLSLPRVVSSRVKGAKSIRSFVGGAQNSPATSLIQLLSVNKGGKMAEHVK